MLIFYHSLILVFEQTDKGENDHQDSDIEVLVGLEDAVSNVIEHPDSIDAVLSIKVPALQCDVSIYLQGGNNFML